MTEENNSEELEEKEISEEETEEGKKFSLAYVRELREEAKKYRTEKAKEKADNTKTLAKLKKMEDANLTDNEKDKKKIAELEKGLVDIQTEYKGKEIDNLILTVASGKNFADIEVVKLLAKKELEGEEDPDIKTIEKVIEKIAKNKPYLVSVRETNKSGDGNFAKNNLEGKKDVDVLFGEMIKEKL